MNRSITHPSDPRMKNIARRLHDCIKRQLKEGTTDPLFIASEALKALEEGRNALGS